MKSKHETEVTEPKKPKEKPKRQKKERSPKEATALMLGTVALGLAVVSVAALMFLSALVGAILGGCAVLGAFASLFVGKGGTFLAVVGMIAGFLTILSAIIQMKMS